MQYIQVHMKEAPATIQYVPAEDLKNFTSPGNSADFVVTGGRTVSVQLVESAANLLCQLKQLAEDKELVTSNPEECPK